MRNREPNKHKITSINNKIMFTVCAVWGKKYNGMGWHGMAEEKAAHTHTYRSQSF